MTRKELKALIKEAVHEVLDEREDHVPEEMSSRHEKVLATLTDDWQSNLDIVGATKLTGQVVNSTLRELEAWGNIERKKVKSKGAAGFKWLNRLPQGED